MTKPFPHTRHKPPYLRYTLIMGLVLFLWYQQSLIASLKNSYKTLSSEQVSLNQRIQELEGQNEQLATALQQIDSRLGYMDSKVMETIESSQKKHTPTPIERTGENRDTEGENRDTEGEPEAESTEEKEGLLNGLRRIFGN